MSGVSMKGKPYDFNKVLERCNLNLTPLSIETLWVNVTRQCNQACRHCHVDASPARREHMNRDVVDRCLALLEKYDQIENLDITGGAPELNPNYDYLVNRARKLNKHVVSRHNLTVIFDCDSNSGGNRKYLPEFFATNQVEILASLPHYESYYTDRVRGAGVFAKSLEGIRLLNEVGYGERGTGLILNLVYNADGPTSPQKREELEAEFRQGLSGYGLRFNRLYAVTNMPVNRYLIELQESGTYFDYMNSLVESFDSKAAKGVACRSLVSVGYDGRIYDCDFNQMLGMQIDDLKPLTVFDFDYQVLINRRIRFGPHCFGCAAGGGAS
jgi:radical SAM/Cys-rich protein